MNIAEDLVGLVHQVLQGLLGVDIARDGNGLAAASLGQARIDFRSHLLADVCFPAGNRDLCACQCHLMCNGLANALAGPCNDGCFS